MFKMPEVGTALGLTFLLSSHALADTVTLAPIRDNTLYEDASGSVSNGAGERVFAGTTGSASIRRALLAFDVEASIAEGATITDVRLTLNLLQTSAGPEPVFLHLASATWGESTSNAPGGEGGGTAAANGDATWLHTFFPSDFWTNAGGDFVPAPSAAAIVDQPGPYEWTSPQMIADVQGSVDNPAIGLSWALVGNETASGSAKAFASRENLPEVRPSLTIEFEPGSCCNEDPVPAVAGWRSVLLALLALGTATWVLCRRAPKPRH